MGSVSGVVWCGVLPVEKGLNCSVHACVVTRLVRSRVNEGQYESVRSVNAMPFW